MKSQSILATSFAVVVGAACLLLNENGSLQDPQSLLAAAQARVGRPATPMSYAGVARRTTRRSVAVGAAAVGAATYGAAYGTNCVQTVNAYGQVGTRCR
jgi:hypothetical protein